MRLFVAVELESALREAARSASEALRASLGERARKFAFTRPETLHFTLKFLGEVDALRVSDIEAAARLAANRPAFPITLGHAGAFPSARHPGVVWLGLSHGEEELTELATSLDEALVAAGFEPEKRPFRAHLTLARARDRRRAPSLDEVLESVPVTPASMVVREIVLFESRLNPTGAVHLPVSRVPFA